MKFSVVTLTRLCTAQCFRLQSLPSTSGRGDCVASLYRTVKDREEGILFLYQIPVCVTFAKVVFVFIVQIVFFATKYSSCLRFYKRSVF